MLQRPLVCTCAPILESLLAGQRPLVCVPLPRLGYSGFVLTPLYGQSDQSADDGRCGTTQQTTDERNGQGVHRPGRYGPDGPCSFHLPTVRSLLR